MPPEPGASIEVWPFRYRLDAINARHAKVTVFDRGAMAGQLTIDRLTWDAMERRAELRAGARSTGAHLSEGPR